MVKLYQFHPAWGLPNASPFCMKLETYLRMAEIPYEAVNADVRKAPKGKLPYIEHNGKVMGDSGLIIEYLKEEFEDKMDKDLDASQRAIVVSINRLLEEHLGWVIVYSRWIEIGNWKKLKSVFFDSLPPIVRSIVPEIVRKSVVRALHGHGMGRHSKEEIYQFGKIDIDVVLNILEDKPFLMGDNPTSIDATVYAFLANILFVPIDSPLKEYTRTFENLLNYCERMKGRFYKS